MYSEAVGRDLTISISTGRFSAPKFKHNVAKKRADSDGARYEVLDTNQDGKLLESEVWSSLQESISEEYAP